MIQDIAFGLSILGIILFILWRLSVTALWCVLFEHKWERRYFIGHLAPTEMDSYCSRCGINKLDWIQANDPEAFKRLEDLWSDMK